MCSWCFGVFVYVVFCWSLTANGMALERIRRDSLGEDVQSYLMQFGYMDKTRDGAFALRTEESVRQSLRELQEFAGLPATGSLDEETKKLLRTPRCGLPDRDVRQTSGRRKRFTIHGPKWPYTNLTWSLRSKNLENLNPYEVRYVMSKALAVWSKHSQLTFTEVDSDNADILIYFYRENHGDNFPFDGRGVVLAHAFFPTGVRSSIEVHFDADEIWTTSGNSEKDGTNLFNVAAHEVGHSLGLSHSNVEDALMYPWYKEMEDGFEYELPEDDKQAIQYLYGSRDPRRNWGVIPEYRPVHKTTTTTTTTTTPRPTPRYTRPAQRPYDPRYPYGRHPYNPYSPQRPDKPYNPNKPMHPDKKPHYPKHKGGQDPYRPDRKSPHHKNTSDRTPDRSYPDQGYPTRSYPTSNPDKHPTHNPERNHPRHEPPKESPTTMPPPETCNTSYDAVAVIRREVFIFKDAYFWRIGEEGLMPGYPAEIRRLWHGLPSGLSHVDAVYERTDGRIVFFVGDKYYVFVGNNVEWGYPKPLAHLGLPRTLKKIDGAMVWGHNGHTYFYSGDKYWKFDEELQRVELDYPRDMSMWKGVGTDIDAVFQWKDGKTYFFKDKGFWKFNDLHMRVDHVEQKLSAPFWMGCSTNYQGKELGQKMPYTLDSTISGVLGVTSSNLYVFLLALVVFFKSNSLICIRLG